MAAGDGFAPPRSPSKGDVLLLDDPAFQCGTANAERGILAPTIGTPTLDSALRIPRSAFELVEPEGVAPSPCPVKSRVPVCCGFDSVELVLAAGLAPALATLSTSCLCCRATRARDVEPPAGVAPARLRYKRNPQPAAGRRTGRSLRCCPGHSGLMKPT